MPHAILSTLHLLIYLILKTTLCCRSCYYYHFIYEATKNKSHKVAELEFELKQTWHCDKEKGVRGNKKIG